jgi:hypothetical protein
VSGIGNSGAVFTLGWLYIGVSWFGWVKRIGRSGAGKFNLSKAFGQHHRATWRELRSAL